MPRPAKKQLFVHLGNMGGIFKHMPSRGKTSISIEMEKTVKLAKRFPKSEFVGIDLKAHSGQLPGNVRQIKADFKKGLEKLEDGSARVISSERALGLYVDGKQLDKKKYTAEVVKLAFRKLAKGGKLLVSIEKTGVEYMAQALKESGFNPKKVKIRPFTKLEYERTGWTRVAGRSGVGLVQITAEK